MNTTLKSIPVLFFATLAFFGCNDAITGVDLTYIVSKFDLDDTTNPVILNIDNEGVCPKMEFDSTNTETFFVRTAPDSPNDSQARFEYATTRYDESGSNRILQGDNDEDSSFELTYDPGLKTYRLKIEYTCTASDGTSCVNASYDCTGPLIE